MRAAAACFKRQGVTELSIRPDYAISLGVFDRGRGFPLPGAGGVERRQGRAGRPRARAEDLVFTIREPDTELVARLTLMQRDHPGSALKAMPCPEK